MKVGEFFSTNLVFGLNPFGAFFAKFTKEKQKRKREKKRKKRKGPRETIRPGTRNDPRPN
jgi:hypothetical protein